MPSFFIEMGQGIIAPPELRVTTSALHNCTLIAGHNTETGLGGAYHYPSLHMEDNLILGYMDTWAARLKPTRVTLVFAPNPTPWMGRRLETSDEDVAFLNRWVRHSCREVEPVADSANPVGVLVGTAIGGGVGIFRTGKVIDLPGDFYNGRIAVDKLHAGTYKLNDNYSYTVIGENRERVR